MALGPTLWNSSVKHSLREAYHTETRALENVLGLHLGPERICSILSVV